MAGIKSPINDLLAKLATLKTNGSDSDFAKIAIFNNQFEDSEIKDGAMIYSFPFPCVFVETLMPNNYNQLGMAITQSDVTFRIHIGQTEYDAQDGSMEQNLSIFDLRDKVIKLLTHYEPTACSRLMKTEEGQDYEHSNIYHYTIDFICAFVDDKGKKDTIIKLPPTDYELNPIEVKTVINH